MDNKKKPFLFVYANGLEWREFVGGMALRGIRIGENIVIPAFIKTNLPEHEAQMGGLQNRDFNDRTELLSEKSLHTLRLRCAEFNEMLRMCDADFRLPLDGPCWVAGEHGHAKAVMFKSGEEVSADNGWAIYKYLA